MKFKKSASIFLHAVLYAAALFGIFFAFLVSVNVHLRFKTVETISHYFCKINSANAVIVGDSIGAGGLHWAGYLGLPLMTTINLAGNGYTFHQVANQIPKAVQYGPKAIIVFAGTNDAFAIQNGRLSKDELKTDVETVIKNCRGIPCILVLPPPSTDSGLNILLNEVRIIVKSVGAANGIHIVDVVADLSHSDGTIKNEFTSDGVHLTKEGYKILSASIAHSLTVWIP